MNNKLLLNDLLKFNEDDINIAKVRFNQANSDDDPLLLYLKNPEIVNGQWFLWKRKKSMFNVGQIGICMLKLSKDEWLLTTIKRITEDKGILNGVNYVGEELDDYASLCGRVIVKYHKSQSQLYWYKNIYKDLEVVQVLPAVFDGYAFPGYDNVRLSFSELETIITRKKADWIGALQNQKAVYLITDKSNGRLYVGSATGDNGMLLQRWTNYVENGHGGNVELKKLEFDYIKKNFQYSILENFNSKVSDEYILSRETWWKNTLDSIKHGYNDN